MKDYHSYNEEIILLRQEIYIAYRPTLLQFFDIKDIDKGRYYFVSMPNSSRDERSSIEIIFECCRIAQNDRLKYT